MKKQFTLLFLAAGFLFLASGCGSTDAAEKTAAKFFSLLIGGKSTIAARLMAPELMSDPNFKMNLQALAINTDGGKLISAKKGFGFNTQISNGVSTVVLPYTLTYEKEVRSCEVQLTDTGEGFRISSILFN